MCMYAERNEQENQWTIPRMLYGNCEEKHIIVFNSELPYNFVFSMHCFMRWTGRLVFCPFIYSIGRAHVAFTFTTNKKRSELQCSKKNKNKKKSLSNSTMNISFTYIAHWPRFGTNADAHRRAICAALYGIEAEFAFANARKRGKRRKLPASNRPRPSIIVHDDLLISAPLKCTRNEMFPIYARLQRLYVCARVRRQWIGNPIKRTSRTGGAEMG